MIIINPPSWISTYHVQLCFRFGMPTILPDSACSTNRVFNGFSLPLNMFSNWKSSGILSITNPECIQHMYPWIEIIFRVIFYRKIFKFTTFCLMLKSVASVEELILAQTTQFKSKHEITSIYRDAILPQSGFDIFNEHVLWS